MSACLWTWDAWQDFGTAMHAVGLEVTVTSNMACT